MSLNKGAGGSTDQALGASDPRVAEESSERSDERVRRRRRHHRPSPTYRSGRVKEITFVTVLALGILFAVLYYFLAHYQSRGEESLVPTYRPERRSTDTT